jgi:hypothetical protein
LQLRQSILPMDQLVRPRKPYSSVTLLTWRTAATKNTIAPAAEVVPALTAAKGNFKWENLQLTQSVLTNLTNLNLTDINFFNFPTSHSPSTSKCKVFPGDADWPSPIAWEVLNLLTGDALIKTVPLAAPCFSNWPEYNATLCATITSLWHDAHLQ